MRPPGSAMLEPATSIPRGDTRERGADRLVQCAARPGPRSVRPGPPASIGLRKLRVPLVVVQDDASMVRNHKAAEIRVRLRSWRAIDMALSRTDGVAGDSHVVKER